MMPQQMRKPTASQLQQIVYQNIQQNTPPMNGMTWQSNCSANERMGKTLDLYVLQTFFWWRAEIAGGILTNSDPRISNIALAMGGLDYNRATEFGCQFEREVFHKSPTKVRTSRSNPFSLKRKERRKRTLKADIANLGSI